MKIFYTVSKTGMTKYLDTYQKVLDEVKKHNVEVFATFKTFPTLLKKFREKSISKKDKKYARDRVTRKVISKVDAVIIEASFPSFKLGFEAFYALSLQKPVLVLSKNKDYSGLIDQPNFFEARYNEFTLPDEIEKFIKHVESYRLRTRFNLFISDRHKQQLSKKARLYGVSMSDYIRKLIEEDVGM